MVKKRQTDDVFAMKVADRTRLRTRGASPTHTHPQPPHPSRPAALLSGDRQAPRADEAAADRARRCSSSATRPSSSRSSSPSRTRRGCTPRDGVPALRLQADALPARRPLRAADRLADGRRRARARAPPLVRDRPPRPQAREPAAHELGPLQARRLWAVPREPEGGGVGGGVARDPSIVGTPFYMAPETIRGKARGVEGATDWWSYGVMVYEFLTGFPPFQGLKVAEIYRSILTMSFVAPIGSLAVSAEAIDLLSRLLVPNPRQRLTARRRSWRTLLPLRRLGVAPARAPPPPPRSASLSLPRAPAAAAPPPPPRVRPPPRRRRRRRRGLASRARARGGGRADPRRRRRRAGGGGRRRRRLVGRGVAMSTSAFAGDRALGGVDPPRRHAGGRAALEHRARGERRPPRQPRAAERQGVQLAPP